MEDPSPVPPTPDELVNIGSGYYHQQRFDVARLHYDAALVKDPDHNTALQNLSSALMTGNLLQAAEWTARRAIRDRTDNLGARINLSAALNSQGRFAEAETEIDKIISEDDTIPAVWHNKGLVLNHQARLAEAVIAYDKALTLSSTAPALRNMILSDRALALLGLGQVTEGCKAYEVRWENKLYKSKCWELGIPQWRGEDLLGKSLILHHEQGFGDGIMLIRLLIHFAHLGAEVIVAVPGPLIELFRNNLVFPIGRVIEWNDEKELRALCVDYHVPMLAALGLLGLEPEKISDKPYISAIPFPDLGPLGYRIGLCWASGDHSFALAHRRRYVPLELFFPLTGIPGVRLVSLQKDGPAKDILNLGAESFIFDPMNKCADFSDTASVIAGLDLVISVDSAVAHLAGAMGKPVLMLGPYVRCWRWWDEISGWPWYRDFLIFKQQIYGDWKLPISQIIRHVNRLVPDKSR